MSTTCIKKVMHGLWKKCQNCDEKYTGTSYYCKVCLLGKRCALKNEKQAMTNQGNTVITFGKHKRVSFSKVYDKNNFYVKWVLTVESASGQLADFQKYCEARIRVDNTKLSYNKGKTRASV